MFQSKWRISGSDCEFYAVVLLLSSTFCMCNWLGIELGPDEVRSRTYGYPIITRLAWTARRPTPKNFSEGLRLVYSSMPSWDNVCYTKPEAKEDMWSTLSTSTNRICTGMPKHIQPVRFRLPADLSSRLVNLLCSNGADYIFLAGLGTSGFVGTPPEAMQVQVDLHSMD